MLARIQAGIIKLRRQVEIYSNFFQVLAVFLIDLSGVLLHLYEQDFDTKFDYPLNGDIRKYMEQLRLGRELEQVRLIFQDT